MNVADSSLPQCGEGEALTTEERNFFEDVPLLPQKEEEIPSFLKHDVFQIKPLENKSIEDEQPSGENLVTGTNGFSVEAELDNFGLTVDDEMLHYSGLFIDPKPFIEFLESLLSSQLDVKMVFPGRVNGLQLKVNTWHNLEMCARKYPGEIYLVLRRKEYQEIPIDFKEKNSDIRSCPFEIRQGGSNADLKIVGIDHKAKKINLASETTIQILFKKISSKLTCSESNELVRPQKAKILVLEAYTPESVLLSSCDLQVTAENRIRPRSNIESSEDGPITKRMIVSELEKTDCSVYKLRKILKLIRAPERK